MNQGNVCMLNSISLHVLCHAQSIRISISWFSYPCCFWVCHVVV